MSRVRKPHQPTCLVLYLAALTMSERSAPFSIEQRIIRRFLVRENVKPAEICPRLHAQFGEAAFSWPRVKVWCNEFKQGRELVANQAHLRRPRTSTTNENIEHVRELIEGGLLRSTAVCYGLLRSLGSS